MEPGTEREQLFEQVGRKLTLHMRIEEDQIYPLVAELQGGETEEESEILPALKKQMDRDQWMALSDLITEARETASVER